MNNKFFSDFITHHNTLQVYKGNRLVFASDKDRLLPLLEYIGEFAAIHQQVTIFDKIMGRAAALLCVKANCMEVYSPLGSELAAEVLRQYGIKCHLMEIVPYINSMNQNEMCPMEKLALNKDPEDFYKIMLNIISDIKQK